jgi:NADH-quinone oxidoreductase subunit L
MLGLVVAGNVAMVFMFWELVGICSYLLIGFWRERQSASNAASKAFIVNRIGDFGMIVGMMVLWTGMGTFSFADYEVDGPDGNTVTMPGIFSQVKPAEGEHRPRVPDGMVMAGVADQPKILIPEEKADYLAARRSYGCGYGLLVVAGLGIFCGCIGKSAQFPLHVWLPDAMEGPTPVSALIHAATMVSAGVYLLLRAAPLLTAAGSPATDVAAFLGAFTALFAAAIALTQHDIKRVLAYSTISQLGYMVAAAGIGAYAAAAFHLAMHAFFKALLFLGAGSVIHGVEHGAAQAGEHADAQDMRAMGGLAGRMPLTFITFLAGGLSLAGFPLLTAGFWSKDAILTSAFHSSTAVFVVLAVAALLTAFYMARQLTLVFLGSPRTGAA